MFVARCPKCATELDVDDTDRGHRVSCPECRTTFVAEPIPASVKVAAKRPPRPRRWDDDSDYLNDSVIPPRHWIDREDDHGPDPLRLVRRELAGPANGLIWTGWIGFLFLIVGGFLAAITGYFDMNSTYGGGGGSIARLAVGAIAATLGSMYFVMIASGGGQMRRVRNRGQAITTAIMGLLTLFTCILPSALISVAAQNAGWLFCLGCLLSLPTAGFGLWALITLNRPMVIEAFDRRKKQG